MVCRSGFITCFSRFAVYYGWVGVSIGLVAGDGLFYVVGFQANTATLHERIAKWALLSGSGSSSHLGGSSLRDALRTIPLKVVVCCTDALSANVAQAAMEQQEWLEIGHETIGVVHVYCLHHQCCLAQKPVILSIPQIATGLVRMGHAMHASLFRERLEAALEILATKAVRQVVSELPAAVLEWTHENSAKLGWCSSDIVEHKDFVLTMLNDSWDEPLDQEWKLTHFCVGGCCLNQEHFVARMRQCLVLVFGGLFAVPLLYRWKHFAGAIQYAVRGLSIHRLLPQIWKFCLAFKAEELSKVELQNMDEDAPDVNPATRQKIRMTKVAELLESEDALDA